MPTKPELNFGYLSFTDKHGINWELELKDVSDLNLTMSLEDNYVRDANSVIVANLTTEMTYSVSFNAKGITLKTDKELKVQHKTTETFPEYSEEDIKNLILGEPE